MYIRSVKSRENPQAEHAKEKIRRKLRRNLTDKEEHLIELSEVALDSEDEQLEEGEDYPKAA